MLDSLTCTPGDLVEVSECFTCACSQKQLLAMIVYLLCESNGMNCTPQQLIKASATIHQQMQESQMFSAMVYLLCTGGGGGGSVLTFNVDPNAEGLKPKDPTQPALAYPKTGGTLYQWIPSLQLWE